MRKILFGQLQENEKIVAYSGGKKKDFKKRDLSTPQQSLLVRNLGKFKHHQEELPAPTKAEILGVMSDTT